MQEAKKKLWTRRQALLTGLFGTGGIGLRAMATGLPISYLLNPRSATAQSLACAIEAREKLQYLIVAASSMGDPVNCNCPGTYETADAVHPQQAEMTPTEVMIDGRPHTAALPWASVEQGGGLAQSTLDQMQFFHHMTRSTVHGDQPKVMRLLGGTAGGEMIPSLYAKHLGPCLETVQAEPVAVGAGGNSSELLSFNGRSLPSISPTQLKTLLTGSSGGFFGGGTSPLVQMRPARDQALDQLYELAKEGSNAAQLAFLDEFALTQSQVRALSEQLADTLDAIGGNSVQDQGLAAAALFSANVTPVVSIRIPFGGDNHTDGDLQTEVDQHVTGTQGIQQVMDAVASLGLTGRVTFAMLNVFGRNLNGSSKVEGRGGRDHYGNHAVSVIIGPYVQPGVIGGVAPIEDGGFGVSDGALGATSIDPATGAPGGSIPAAETQVALAMSLGPMLGIPAEQMSGDFVASAGGAVVTAAIKST